MKKNLIILTAFILFTQNIFSNERHFSYTYESNILAPQMKEIEVWNTFRNERENFYKRIDQRIEFEIGVCENLQTAFYLNSTNKLNHKNEKENSIGFSNEWKYKLSDNVADIFGSSIYGEFGISTEEIEFEGKIILDKQIGNNLFALNLVSEKEIETEVSHENSNTEVENKTIDITEIDFGYSYKINNSFSIGVEGKHHIKSEDNEQFTATFFGPTFSYSTESWWTVVTVIPQLTKEFKKHEKLETRILFSYHI